MPAIVRRPGEDAEEEGEASEEGEAREGGGPSEARPDETEERSRNAASRSSASVAGCEARMPSAFRKYCSSTCARFACTEPPVVHSSAARRELTNSLIESQGAAQSSGRE